MNKCKLLAQVLGRIINHPLNKKQKLSALLRFLKWQINVRINPYPIIYNYTENSKLIVGRGMTTASGNFYCGLLEYADMAFTLHFLREDDLFVDIGANIGTYTVLGSAEVKAKTICIEPIPTTFQILQDNIAINRMENRVEAMNIGLGSSESVLKFTAGRDAVNRVATGNEADIIEVPVKTLDDVLDKRDPIMLKIDVEGFETEVFRGGKNVLEKGTLKVIIIELNRAGERYGFNDADIHQLLIKKGFSPYTYDPVDRVLKRLETFGSKQNTLYLRDLPFVTHRVSSARKIWIRNAVI